MARRRRDKLTPEVQSLFVKALSVGATHEVASAFAGIARATVWRWLKRGEAQGEGKYRAFADAVRAAEGQAAVQHLAAVHAAAKDSWQAAAWLLERRHPTEYGRQKFEVKSEAKIEHQHSGAVALDLKKLSDQELDVLEQILARQEAVPEPSAEPEDAAPEGGTGP